MLRAISLALPLLLVPVAAPTLPLDGAAVAQSRTGEDCERQNQRNRRRGRGIGGFIGGFAGGRLGPVGNVVTNVLPVGSLLGEAIASLLDCREQRQAAAATEEAVRTAQVGTSASWQSETRPNVSGTSTVTAVDTASVDGECLTVTDVIIVDGEETTAPKRMCKRPPSNRYVRV